MNLNSYGVDIVVLAKKTCQDTIAWTMMGILAFEVSELPKKKERLK